MRPTACCIFEALEPRQLLSGFIDLPGVMPAALDLPHINLLIRRPGGDPLAADLGGGTTFNIDALYSTGASGIILSGATADALGINRITHDDQTVFYSDVGITASDYFNVSELLMLHLAPSHPDADLDNLASWIAVYTQGFGSLRAKISGQDGLDIIGMPAMADRVVVIDPKPLNSFSDTLRTYVYAPGTPYDADFSAWDPGIPNANLNVQLTYSSFVRFTSLTPDGAPGPALAQNVFIGPDPVAAMNPAAPADNAPGVTVRFNGASADGSWLLDTGSSASIISLSTALRTGVRYAEGTFNTASPVLVDMANQPLANQFTMELGGAGGTRVAGYFLSSLEIPTVEGQTIRFLNAPVLVSDITMRDPLTQETLTLDGVLGMNYLAASARIAQTPSGPAFTNLTEGFFDWITINQPAGLLGLSYTVPSARPSASANVVNVTKAGGGSHTFTVTYSGNPAIDWTTIDDDDILVIGPDGTEYSAWLMGLDADANGPVRLATYMIDAPNFEWTVADNGQYAVYVLGNAVADTAGRFAARAQIGSFTVSIRDTTAPVATVGKLASPKKGSTYTFKVVHSDNVAVKAATVGHGDVIVTGPKRFKQAAKLVSKSAKTDSGRIIATYRIVAPGKSWDASDKGVYTITLQRKQVSDASGNFAAAKKIGKFSYPLPKAKAKKPVKKAEPPAANGRRDTTAPVAAVGKLASPGTGPGYMFKVAYRDNVAVKAATVGHGDVIVTGPKRFKQAAKLVSKSAKTDSGRIIATYRIVAPGKSWDASDKGTYRISLRGRQVSDASGNFAAAKQIGTFTHAPTEADTPVQKAVAAAVPATPFSTQRIQSHVGESPEPVWA